ncbi:hypothetical protein [Demequina sp. NBRC 110056]|uniref:hypothetical protein n=1 Tax=Demequina sp. NBRC 110056 TaxID=1570345 RepID=UPI000A045AA0|nr:hypothetical protein [Demequina sp. NBRC 110056]
MALADPSVAPARSDSPVDRRRILTGAAWATPAIVIGMAAPAAASSGGSSTPQQPGALALVSASAERVILFGFNAYTARATAVFAGAAGSASVTGVRMRISFDSGRAGATAPTIASGSTGWSFSATTVTGSRRHYDFVYSSPVSAPSGATTALEISFVGTWRFGASERVDFQAFGTSQNVNVQSSVFSDHDLD